MEPSKTRAASHGAPARSWRNTITLLPKARSVFTVSTSDSPFPTDELATATLLTFAPSAFAAFSKEMRVRVEAS